MYHNGGGVFFGGVYDDDIEC